jgi:DNA-binding MarR family transcriptional regulator
MASGDNGNPDIVLGILEAIDSGDLATQRAVASELGVALGLVNAYLKRCIKKGLVKVGEAPARRYAYYLTPKGFAEKAKLTTSYLSHSFSFFRMARTDCEAVLAEVVQRKMRRLMLGGASDLVEIIRVCAIDRPVVLTGIVDSNKTGARSNLPLVSHYDQLDDVDALIVTDLIDPQQTYEAAVAALGEGRVFIPELLRRGRLRGARVKSQPSTRRRIQ